MVAFQPVTRLFQPLRTKQAADMFRPEHGLVSIPDFHRPILAADRKFFVSIQPLMGGID
jgi:hypothetical protein